MIVHRFMSAREYQKLMAGEVLQNRDKHKGYKSTSVGFCFFTEPPSDAIHWLGGNVDADYCVTMDIPKERLTQSVGRYRDPSKHDPMSSYISSSQMMVKREWCCKKYSTRTVKVLHVTTEYEQYTVLRQILKQRGLIR